MTIYFDMDGTIADFYSVEGWLDDLQNCCARPYAEARPLVRMNVLARRIHQLQSKGYKVGIISWLSKESNNDFDRLVTETKLKWLSKHLPSVEWNEIHIVSYGTPKSNFGSGILFDDEERNRTEWGNGAYSNFEIFEILKGLL